MRSNRNRAVLAGSSLVVIGIALAAPPVLAQDTTIATSVTTGTIWSGATSPGSNFTITATGTISTPDPNAITITGGPGATLGTLSNSGRVNDTAPTGTAIFVGATGTDTISVAELANMATGTISAVRTGILLNAVGTIGVLTNAGRDQRTHGHHQFGIDRIAQQHRGDCGHHPRYSECRRGHNRHR
ncbi:hypothetical protein [Sphingomonas sp. 22R3R2A-7]|uniref:hypothetical protein n=1 Tax=Sphingomonas sp. 22R3R2A-7 TaxID=3050230 RepID=UPI002FE00B93